MPFRDSDTGLRPPLETVLARKLGAPKCVFCESSINLGRSCMFLRKSNRIIEPFFLEKRQVQGTAHMISSRQFINFLTWFVSCRGKQGSSLASDFGKSPRLCWCGVQTTLGLWNADSEPTSRRLVLHNEVLCAGSPSPQHTRYIPACVYSPADTSAQPFSLLAF